MGNEGCCLGRSICQYWVAYFFSTVAYNDVAYKKKSCTRDIAKYIGKYYKNCSFFSHVVHVSELIGHPIGPKFGQYLQLINIHVCTVEIFEIFIWAIYGA